MHFHRLCILYDDSHYKSALVDRCEMGAFGVDSTAGLPLLWRRACGAGAPAPAVVPALPVGKLSPVRELGALRQVAESTAVAAVAVRLGLRR